MRYSLSHPYAILDCPPSKFQWKRVVRDAINTYWANVLKERAALYTTLHFLYVENYWPGRKHLLIKNIGSVADVPRIHTRLKMVTGVYVLQVNRVAFNQNQIDATCQLCQQADETIDHFLLDCPSLELARQPVLGRIIDTANSLSILSDKHANLLQIILDCSRYADGLGASHLDTMLTDLEVHCRRLCHKLHTERYKRLSLIPKRHRNKRKQ